MVEYFCGKMVSFGKPLTVQDFCLLVKVCRQCFGMTKVDLKFLNLANLLL